MAHQKKSSVTQFRHLNGAKFILERPKLAALLGAVAAEWASLESGILDVYSFLMGVSLPRPPGPEVVSHQAAFQVFDTLETLHLRLELLRKLAQSVILNNEELSKSCPV